MNIPLMPHGQRGTLLAICGFDGSGKSTLEAALLAAITPTRTCVPAWAPTEWWRQDQNVRRSLFGDGTGQVLPEEALLHFNLADCYTHQAAVIVPALARGEVVIVNRYLFDMLALFEARGLAQPEWLPGAVAHIVKPDFCFVLDGSAELIVDRVVRRDGVIPGRFDQDIKFTERYNAALRRMAEENHLTVLRVEADPGEILRQCLDVLSESASFDTQELDRSVVSGRNN
ncbi:dTMP kinase [Streptomyces spongiae]|nr:hypothetical protein [Streptomyces spongiae]